MKYLVPFEAIALMGWWMWQVRGPGSLDPFGIENIGTILLQWAIAFALLLFFNDRIAKIAPTETAEMDAGRMPPSIR